MAWKHSKHCFSSDEEGILFLMKSKMSLSFDAILTGRSGSGKLGQL